MAAARTLEQRFADCFNDNRPCAWKGERVGKVGTISQAKSMALDRFGTLKPWCHSVSDKIRGLWPRQTTRSVESVRNLATMIGGIMDSNKSSHHSLWTPTHMAQQAQTSAQT